MMVQPQTAGDWAYGDSTANIGDMISSSRSAGLQMVQSWLK